MTALMDDACFRNIDDLYELRPCQFACSAGSYVLRITGNPNLGETTLPCDRDEKADSLRRVTVAAMLGVNGVANMPRVLLNMPG